MPSTWTVWNRALTRRLMHAIEAADSALPPGAKLIIATVVPGGAALVKLFDLSAGVAEAHKYVIIHFAKKCDNKGKLSKEAKAALHAYQRALEAEERSYNRFLLSFERHTLRT